MFAALAPRAAGLVRLLSTPALGVTQVPSVGAAQAGAFGPAWAAEHGTAVHTGSLRV
jgi:hypothetical protein